MIEVAARDGVVLMPNPHQVSLERFAEFTPEQQVDMQGAYMALQASAGRSMRDTDDGSSLGVTDHMPFYRQVGLERFVDSFKNLRYIMGEDEFSGLQPTYLADTERTLLDPYFDHMARGELIITDWQDHDVRVHLMGALLAERTLTTTLVESARTAPSLPVLSQEAVAGALDNATAQVNRLWLYPVERDRHIFDLEIALDRLDVLALRSTLALDGVMRVAQQQAYFIDDFVSKDIFVPTNPVR